MGPGLPVEWVALQEGRPPSSEARQSLEEWAEARGVRLAPPREVRAAVPPLDRTVAESVEEELERARDAITALDVATAEGALTKAEALLRGHPELPAAAWLLAEVERAWAARWWRLPTRDGERSARAWSLAAGLDGGRAAGVGEGAAAGRPAAVTARLELDAPGLREGSRVSLDGVLVKGAAVATFEGDHQLTVTRDGAVVAAAWVAVGRDATLHVPVPRPVPCSAEDLAGARVSDGAVTAPDVTCGAWVLARETGDSPGELGVATCGGSLCGPLLRWKVGPLGPVVPESRLHAGHWPAWATWTIAGASVLAVTGVALAASGAFRPTHDEPAFVTGGLHVAAAPVRLWVP